MNLLIVLLLFVASCLAFNTTIDFITSNELLSVEMEEYARSSTYYDMSQIRRAIKNAEEILKMLNINKKPQRVRPSDIVQFYCASPAKKHFTQTYFDDTEITDKLDTAKPIVFIVHGWMDTASSPWIIELSNAWIKNRDTNVCRVDWSLYSRVGYVTAVIKKIRIVAQFVADFIKSLKKKHNMSYTDMTIAGHSLGGHLVGFIGQYLNSRIGLILGLDPAGPLFTVPIILPEADRLDATDAQKVIIIHSCDGILGINIACGFQDFYPNKGKFPQKGCTWPSVQNTFEGRTDAIRCAHLRAVQYLIESLQPNNKCIGIKCNNIVNYLLRNCKYHEELRVENVVTPGQYYFTTSVANCTGTFW